LPVVSYADVRAAIGNDRLHLLIGNGFSVACDPVFAYTSLYERAVQKGLSARAQALFTGLGTNNFEGVMHLLDKAHWVARTYGLIDGDQSVMLDDLAIVKNSLVEAIAESHLDNTGDVSEAKKATAKAFFAPYHNIFTTNYDLLAYWVVLSDGHPEFRDGFGDDPDEPDSPTVVFSFHLGDQKGIFYLHGGLHLFTDAGHVTKHCWSRSGEALTNLIRAGLAEGRYPLFVAEGTADKKLEQIYNSAYLSYALDKLGRITKHLVVFGSSLGESDDHIRRAIARNRKLTHLYLSVRDAANTAKADATVAAIRHLRNDYGLPDITIQLYTTSSAPVWAAA
jgi:hypothetical protein